VVRSLPQRLRPVIRSDSMRAGDDGPWLPLGSSAHWQRTRSDAACRSTECLAAHHRCPVRSRSGRVDDGYSAVFEPPWPFAHQLFGMPGVIVQNDLDLALVERCRRGDREAFTELVIRYQKPVYNAAYWVLRKVEDANDITQVVFLRVWERLDEYDSQYKFFSWIYRIAVNESLNLLRRGGREEALDEDFDVADAESANPESRLASTQQSKQIERALMRMATNDRLVLTLRHFSDCSYQEIGQILDLDEKTVKSRLFEARQRLRGLLNGLRGK